MIGKAMNAKSDEKMTNAPAPPDLKYLEMMCLSIWFAAAWRIGVASAMKNQFMCLYYVLKVKKVKKNFATKKGSITPTPHSYKLQRQEHTQALSHILLRTPPFGSDRIFRNGISPWN